MRIGAEEQEFNIEYHSTEILRNANDIDCETCQKSVETTQRLITAGTAFAMK